MCPSNEPVTQPESNASVADDAMMDKQPATSLPVAPVNPTEIGGRKGPEPTRYGDWEQAGRCIDF